ncbi:endonuclease domain-containing protein [Wenzhouxiangella sp. XN79A]|uniref:endonuclease domain-containing protein n=1 Tax=Wenzhouxiangella sp. XN79A TaxID=2724193 RepID=UPI00144A558C|nr:endonuclease domain-containing protein [Wenzhouxiangella sp. XN79A]NKI35938.1 endonuclease domain-containing protein [Wenzhouxiangella sp. XN79A]
MAQRRRPPSPEVVPSTEPVRLQFDSTTFDADRGDLDLRWTLIRGASTQRLGERFEFGPGPAPTGLRRTAFDAAVRLLHRIAGVSYWKTACRGTVELSPLPDPEQAALLTAVYRDGLAELAWRNGLDAPWWPAFPVVSNDAPPAPELGLAERVLVPMGGGKDSLVALERVRVTGLPFETVQVGGAGLIGRVAERTGVAHRVIGRRLDPALRRLNDAGALNGHVPITAINAAVLAVAAVLWDVRDVVFANERSADTPTLEVGGRAVNHQWAKSLVFEAAFDDWLQRHVAADLRVFSLLRRDRELAITREFAGLERYHDVFSSCNRNFHLDGPRTERWCGACPKCRFVYLAMAPFLDPPRMGAIFGRDLLADVDAIDGFAELLELDGHRPFECVGEADEARAAVLALAADPRWQAHPVVRALADRLGERDVPSLELLCRPDGPDRIPERFRALAAG